MAIMVAAVLKSSHMPPDLDTHRQTQTNTRTDTRTCKLTEDTITQTL